MEKINFREHLKNTKFAKDTRWIVKRTELNGRIKEVKQIYNPESYKNVRDRTLYNQEELIKVLDAEKLKTK